MKVQSKVTTKVIKEVEAIIADTSMSVWHRMRALDQVELSGRPGREAAELMMDEFRKPLIKKRTKFYQDRFNRNRNVLSHTHCRLIGYESVYNLYFNKFASQYKEADDLGECLVLVEEYFKAQKYHLYQTISYKTFGRLMSIFVAQHRDLFNRLVAEHKAKEVHFAKCNKENEEWRTKYGVPKYSFNHCARVYEEIHYPSLLTATKEDAVILGNYAFVSYEDVEKDWNYYAKSYGFPKVTVEGRGIKVYKNGKKIDDLELDAFRGYWFIDAVAKYLNVTPPKVDKALRRFQVTKWTDVKRSVSKDGFQLYKLMFDKYVVGYVAYDKTNDIHYHADTIDDAIAGLKDKIVKVQEERKADDEQANKKWNAVQLHTTFGFCYPGIAEFAHACNLDREQEYTVKELRNAVKNISDTSVLTKYRRELRLIKVLTA